MDPDDAQPRPPGHSPLPAPFVPEAPDGCYDYEETFRLTVRIPPYPGMAANDVVTVHWRTWDALHKEPLRVHGSWVGGAVVVPIGNARISASATRVHYEVAYAAGGTAVSEPLVLNDR
ncbi:hypothetical protein [Streptomyces sp. NPDC058953]|uniref:hypothetical protein n=1 Tax=unclassified Streptomyces TaxID=2593676 RepID=UPI0036C92B1C